MEENIGAAEVGQGKSKRSVWQIIRWVVLVLILIFIAVQFINADRYDALVQVIDDNRVGVNPTGSKLDFGDLPHNKEAVRTVTMSSSGNSASYIIVWKRGDISDFIKLNKNFFTLSPRSTEKLEFTVSIPDSAENRYYKGKVTIFKIPKFW